MTQTQNENNERFGTLRSILARPATIVNFGELVQVLEDWEGAMVAGDGEEHFSNALYYVKEHLSSWPEHTRYAQLFPSSALFSLLAPLYQCFGTYTVKERYFEEDQGGTMTLFLDANAQPRYYWQTWWHGTYDGSEETEYGRVAFEKDALILFPEQKRNIVSRDIGEDSTDERRKGSGHVSIPLQRHEQTGIFIPRESSFFGIGADWENLEYEPPSMWSNVPFYGGDSEYGEFEFIPMGTQEYRDAVAKYQGLLP